MKKFSIYISIFLVLGSFFYGLTIISNDNQCTSVRKYLSECKTATTNEVQVIPKVTGTVKNIAPEVEKKEKTIDYALVSYILINTSSYFIGWLETWFDKIIDKETYYEVVYSWKDNVIVDIAKDKNKVISVLINWVWMSNEEITKIFLKYYN